ncbi:MAG: hypothetical protein ABUL72_03115 [Armatimonadota bacterium]
MDKSSKTIYIGLGVVCLVALGIAFSPSDKPARKTPTVGKAGTVSTKVKQEDKFDERDANASFDRLSTSPKNGFRPVIARRSIGHGSGPNVAPNQIPSEFAGGEGGWVYTGTASIDSTPAALFENKGKSEAIYVHIGEKWKKSTITGISQTTVQMLAQSGKVHTLDLLADPPDNGKITSSSSSSGNRNAFDASSMPLAIEGMPGTLPGLPGGMTFQATDPSMMAQPGAAQAPTAQPNNGGGRRQRGGGRNRGNGGGGGGAAGVTAAPVAPVPARVGGTNFQPEVSVESLPDTPIDN